MVTSCSYASAARWAYTSASVKFGGVGGKKAVGLFFPQEETLTITSAKTPSIKVYRMAKDRAVGIQRVRSFHEGETVILDRQHLIVGEVKRLTSPTLNRFRSCARPGQRWMGFVLGPEPPNSNLLWHQKGYEELAVIPWIQLWLTMGC
jgi:hypothetical protein